MNVLQINWLQPIYTFSFSNGLIACLVFLGIGTLLDVGFVMQRPFRSMFLAVCAEAGTLITFPLGVWLGLPANQAAATATIGGADGPMVLFASLILAKEIFVPITVVGYLYLGLSYGGYPFMIKAMVPKSIRGMTHAVEKVRPISSDEKLIFAVVTCTVLCLLFPVAAPLFLSVFVGVVIRESGLTHFYELFSNTVLYGATFFLGLLLGVLCEANTILDPTVLILLILGIAALTFSAIGGLLGGYVLYFASGRQVQPDHRHRRGELRADDRQGGAEGSLADQSRGDHPAARAGRQRLRRDHHGGVRGGARHLASPALTEESRGRLLAGIAESCRGFVYSARPVALAVRARRRLLAEQAPGSTASLIWLAGAACIIFLGVAVLSLARTRASAATAARRLDRRG